MVTTSNLGGEGPNIVPDHKFFDTEQEEHVFIGRFGEGGQHVNDPDVDESDQEQEKGASIKEPGTEGEAVAEHAKPEPDSEELDRGLHEIFARDRNSTNRCLKRFWWKYSVKTKSDLTQVCRRLMRDASIQIQMAGSVLTTLLRLGRATSAFHGSILFIGNLALGS